jgi:sugar transferase (PEP-CTERM system associated)
MIRIFKHYVPKSLVWLGLIEVIVLIISVRVGISLRSWVGEISVPSWEDGWLQVFFFVVISYIVMLATGLYRLETCRDIKLSMVRLFISLAISLLLMSAILFAIPSLDLWRSVLIFCFMVAFLNLLLVRFIFLHLVDLNRFKKRVLVLGAGERAELVKAIGVSQNSYVEFIDFLQMTDKETVIAETKRFDSIKDLSKFVAEHSVHEIVVAIQERRGNLPLETLLKCKVKTSCKIIEAADFIEKQLGLVKLGSVSPSWLIFSDGFGGVGSGDLIVKRFFDVVASSVLLLISLPILICTALLVKITSKGPVFYKQERVGLNSKTYNVLKFRSMTVNAESDSGPKMADKNDIRVTAVGQVIRKTRIDEIPQIFNVLNGDMSFVGPRPERPFFVDQFNVNIPYYSERHVVKPGITGWAQLNYPYGASEDDTRRKLEYDLYYIKNYSIFLDILILIQTVRVVLWPDGVR